MMRPECAVEGTVTSRPLELALRWAAGELRLIVAPAERGNATIMPALRPMPWISSVPRWETWCGLTEQLAAGMQLTCTIRMLVTCALTVLAVTGVLLLEGAAGTVWEPGADVPPGLFAALAGAATSSS